MHCLKRFLLTSSGVLFAFAAVPAHAGVFAYATNYRQELWKVDMTTSGSVLIGNIGFVSHGLAQTSSGKLYGSDGNQLYDVTGGVPTLLYNMGAFSIGAFDSDGATLWGFDNNSKRLFDYDIATATVLTWSSVLPFNVSINAMAIDGPNNFLLVDDNNKLIKVANGTWNASLVGAMSLADKCMGVDFLSDGNFYGLVLGDTRYQIDPNTGAVINGFYSGVHRDWADMTALPNAAPEPGTLAALAIGGLSLFRRRSYRARNVI